MELGYKFQAPSVQDHGAGWKLGVGVQPTVLNDSDSSKEKWPSASDPCHHPGSICHTYIPDPVGLRG